MGTFETTGGFRCGDVNATAPYAKLTASAQTLKIEVPIFQKLQRSVPHLQTSFSFRPDQVVALLKHTSVPVIGWGVRITHSVRQYHDNLIFWCWRPGRVLLAIEATGFSPRSSGERVADRAGFDVFLCHNVHDKPQVREMNEHLKRAGLRTWLDEEQLLPGRPWQIEIEKRIGDVRTAIVFVGDSGIGPWQDVEMRALLSEFAQRGAPVIPVILPGTSSVPELPMFLRGMTWLDLRSNKTAGVVKMIDAIRSDAS